MALRHTLGSRVGACVSDVAYTESTRCSASQRLLMEPSSSTSAGRVERVTTMSARMPATSVSAVPIQNIFAFFPIQQRSFQASQNFSQYTVPAEPALFKSAHRTFHRFMCEKAAEAVV
jgi:hypothetical protein